MVVSELDIQVPSVSLDYPDQAIITIESTTENLRFDSNMNGIVAQARPSPGEYVLYVVPENQILTIDTPGFIQQRYPLRGLNARSVVSLLVEPERPEGLSEIPVNIRLRPEQAFVRLNGDLVDINRSIFLPEGDHIINAELEGFRSLERNIEVTRDQNFFEFTMEETTPEPVRIRTEPPGATVFLEGVDFGQADRNGLLEFYRFPGRYSISVSQSGYIAEVRDIEIVESAINEYLFTL